MGIGFDSRRRKLGIVCLAVPAGMLILGQTALKSSLSGFAFLAYWLICFLFIIAAIFIALVDLRAVRRQTREETRALLEATLLSELQRKRQDKPGKSDNFV